MCNIDCYITRISYREQVCVKNCSYSVIKCSLIWPVVLNSVLVGLCSAALSRLPTWLVVKNSWCVLLSTLGCFTIFFSLMVQRAWQRLPAQSRGAYWAQRDTYKALVTDCTDNIDIAALKVIRLPGLGGTCCKHSTSWHIDIAPQKEINDWLVTVRIHLFHGSVHIR